MATLPPAAQQALAATMKLSIIRLASSCSFITFRAWLLPSLWMFMRCQGLPPVQGIELQRSVYISLSLQACTVALLPFRVRASSFSVMRVTLQSPQNLGLPSLEVGEQQNSTKALPFLREAFSNCLRGRGLAFSAAATLGSLALPLGSLAPHAAGSS